MSDVMSDKSHRLEARTATIAAAAIVLVLGGASILLVRRALGTPPGGASPAPAVAAAAPASAAMQWAAVLRTSVGSGPAQDLSWLQTGVANDGRPWMGAAHPSLEIDEFVDFQCPKCCEACPFLQRLFARFPNQVRIYMRHLPRTQAGASAADDPGSRSCQMASAAICAGRQGQYWEAHDYLFSHREQLSEQHTCAAALCQTLGLDYHAFRSCMEDPAVRQSLERDATDARNLGITETPTFVVQGKAYARAIPDEVLAGLSAHDGN